MKMTVLELVQQIGSKLNSDEINSIADTTESLQIALELQATYYAMLDNVEWPYQYNLISLEASGDVTKPTHMKLPEAVDNFKWIKYKDGLSPTTNYKTIQYLQPDEFLEMIFANTADQSIEVQDYSGAYFLVGNTRDPQYYTSFDDTHIVFDSYNADIDSTLQSSKVMALAQTIPTFVMEDDAYPDLPTRYFPMLLAEATAACFFYAKQMQSPIDERRARRSYVRHFNNVNRAQEADKTVLDFGR